MTLLESLYFLCCYFVHTVVPVGGVLDMGGDTATNIGLVFGVWLVVDCFMLGQATIVCVGLSGHL